MNNSVVIKACVCLVLMVAFLIMAFITKDIISSKIFTSLGLVTGTFAFYNLSAYNETKNE